MPQSTNSVAIAILTILEDQGATASELTSYLGGPSLEVVTAVLRSLKRGGLVYAERADHFSPGYPSSEKMYFTQEIE